MSILLSVLDRLWVPNVVVGDVSLSPDLFIWLSTPVVPDLLFELWLISTVRLVDCVCLFRRADRRFSVGDNLLWPLDFLWLPTVLRGSEG